MQNRVRLEIVDGALKGKKLEFAEHDTFIFGRVPDLSSLHILSFDLQPI